MDDGIYEQVALVEAGEGIAIVPSYGILACRDQRTCDETPAQPSGARWIFMRFAMEGESFPPLRMNLPPF